MHLELPYDVITLSLTGSASRTDLSQLANGIWEIHAGCSSFLHVLFVAKIGYIPQFKASNTRDQDEVSSDLARMELIKQKKRGGGGFTAAQTRTALIWDPRPPGDM